MNFFFCSSNVTLSVLLSRIPLLRSPNVFVVLIFSFVLFVLWTVLLMDHSQKQPRSSERLVWRRKEKKDQFYD
jgi:hypothetical protein